jgi:hypothetical protein
MIKRFFQAVVLFFALYAFCFMPLGRKTALEHLRAIAGTPAAKQAASELGGSVTKLVNRLRSEAQRSTDEGSADPGNADPGSTQAQPAPPPAEPLPAREPSSREPLSPESRTSHRANPDQLGNRALHRGPQRVPAQESAAPGEGPVGGHEPSGDFPVGGPSPKAATLGDQLKRLNLPDLGVLDLDRRHSSVRH